MLPLPLATLAQSSNPAGNQNAPAGSGNTPTGNTPASSDAPGGTPPWVNKSGAAPETTSPTGGMTTPPTLKGPLPPGSGQSMPTPPAVPTTSPTATLEAKKKLDELVDESLRTSGAMFKDPDQIITAPPLLSALITLDKHLPSPYELDAGNARQINLRDTVMTARSNNLVIKITQEESEAKRWTYLGSIGGFLPNVITEFSLQGLTGQYISPAGAALPLNNYYINMPAGIQQYLYQGGKILHTFLQDKHRFKASQFALKGSTNDVLLDASKLYYELVENDAMLQIRIKAVETSSALYLINQDLYDNGVNSMLEVLQAKTQLSKDRQHLIKAQVERRQSAIKLAKALNLDFATDLTPDRQVRKVVLVDKNLTPGDLLKIAIDNRPELKRYSELRLAAKESIKVAKAPLLPQVSVTGTTVGTFARIARNQQGGQQTALTTSGGASVGAVSGGSGLALAQGGDSGRKDAGRSLFLIGLDVQWTLGGLGVTSLGNVQAARATARKVQLEFLDELNRVQSEVRDAYLSSLSAEALIAETTDAVNSSAEQLRVAKNRIENGVGTQLDVLNAQRDYTQALIDKAKAICEYNTAQIKLLRAIGRITVNTVIANNPLRD
jgi:outer membrane protein TolC